MGGWNLRESATPLITITNGQLGVNAEVILKYEKEAKRKWRENGDNGIMLDNTMLVGVSKYL